MASDHSSESEPAVGTSRIWLFVSFVFVAIIVGFLLVLVLRYGLSIPRMDDWDLMPLIANARKGALTFSDLFAQQQESRTFFPKLIFILSGLGHRWDGRVQMVLSIFICCLTSLGIYGLLRKCALSAKAAGVAVVMMALLIFSPVQYELWLLASGSSSFMPALFIVGGLFVLKTDLSVSRKFWLCACLAFLSSFAFANGLLAWPLTFPLLFRARPMLQWKPWLVAWLAACAFCCAIYFLGYQPPRELPAFAPPKPLLTYLLYILAFLGSGLGRAGNENPLVTSVAAGAFLLLGYLAALGWGIYRWRDREFWSRMVPWFSLGAYGIGSGVLAALGRIELGVLQALASRYVAFSLYLVVAMIAFVTIFAAERLAAPRASGAKLALFTAAVFLAASYLTLEILCAAAAVSTIHLDSASARVGQGAVLFSQVIDSSDAIRRTNHPAPNVVRQNANALDRLHLLRPSLVRSTVISKLRHADADKINVDGWLDSFAESRQPGMVAARGWAALAGQGRSADSVILAYEREDHEWIVFAISSSIEMRPDVARLHQHPDWLWSGWRVVFRADAVPKGANISAWALDAKQAKVYRLGASADKFDR